MQEVTQQGGLGEVAIASLLVLHDFNEDEIAVVLRMMLSGKGIDATDQYLQKAIGKTLVLDVESGHDLTKKGTEYAILRIENKYSKDLVGQGHHFVSVELIDIGGA